MQVYKKLNFAHIIPEAVSRFSNLPALSFVDTEPMTYAEMGMCIDAVIAFCEKQEIIPGDKVAIFAQNMPNWGIAYFALQCMGVIAVPLLPDFNTHELENVLNHSEAKAIFISKNLEYKLKNIKSEYLKIIICLDSFSITESNVNKLPFVKNAKPTKTYSPNEEELSVLIYTSGTTGNSKGVMLSQKNILTNVYQSGNIQPIGINESFLSVLPLSHTYENTLGLILPIISGANVTYLRKPPTANVLLPALKKVRPHFMLTVPMIIEKVFKGKILPQIESKTVTKLLYKARPTQKLLHFLAGKKLYETFGGRLKFFGIGGAKLDKVVEQFLRDAKFPYAIGYGLTESSPLLAGSNPSMTKLQAIGPKAINLELKINKPNPQTGIGEIWAKGPNVMLGYYKNEEATQDVFTKDGWFKTGDLGVFDKNGWLSHKGRLKNMIVGANGENIYPEDIESVINNFKHVIESVVVEQKGKLVALVHFNREELEQKISQMAADISHRIDEVSKIVDDKIDELAIELQQYTNSRVNKYSRIQALVVHSDPFQKTSTKKIKRYLYA